MFVYEVFLSYRFFFLVYLFIQNIFFIKCIVILNIILISGNEIGYNELKKY